MDISPFTISVSQDVLTDLKMRLGMARIPVNVDLPSEDEWEYGTPTGRVKELVDYWKTTFNWRKMESTINVTLPQFTTLIDAGPPHRELKIHFVHKRSSNPTAIPLLFVHGWPGNFLEVSKIIDPLVNPTDPKDHSFHIVAPSLPGYVFSQGSRHPGLGLRTTADMFDKLMKKLGYPRYIAQGGDWGAMIIKAMALRHSDSCCGTHTNIVMAAPSFRRDPVKLIRAALSLLGLPGGYSREEADGLKDATRKQTPFDDSMGYMRIQSTKPQTLAYGLTDSPVGLLAWIYEKLHGWSDDYQWTPDEVLTWVMLYWISDSGPVGSLRYYKESQLAKADGEFIEVISSVCEVPIGVSAFPKELYKFPAVWAGTAQPLKYYKPHSVGGHFAAYEQPNLLVEDIRRFTEIVISENDWVFGGSDKLERR
ncbi:hypothetical protein M422DRAFT_782904 [Sphaerobolus stellatus SS14]|uniref:Epoxide hydrolase N-terminal domain-containing protein n=1 Tax=Sphaerobolus stellatus (strain SS14) TaxID=990650 RepID=A0A0C9V9W3_SPHS4|nr:hypothetical protein M422DRAFT_782904 [Sphaerobolus stellatus SS14]